MKTNYDMKDLINTISTKSGLFGVFANHGFGSTTLLMQIASAVADINKGTVIVFLLNGERNVGMDGCNQLVCQQKILW